MNLKLKGKAALVTGGSKGIGLAIVESLLGEGASVASVSRNAKEGDALSERFKKKNLPFTFIQGDVTESDACRSAVDQTLEKFGRLDVLVNNVGMNDGVSLAAGPAAFSESLRRNVVHYYATAHYALETLKQSQGAIVNVGSKVAVTGQGGTSGYAAAKGAINALTREWAVELADCGVRVNAVIPAETWTPLYENWLSGMTDPEQARRQIERLIPLGRRFTTADEIAATVVFLASPVSAHTTGQIVYVDGGYTHLDRKLTAESS